jgi:Fe-S cluster assembly protein SufB
MVSDQDRLLNEVTQSDYKYGFYTDVDIDSIPKGLNEEVIRTISGKKGEPEFMLEFRLKAYRHWLTMKMPQWAHLTIPEINYQDIIYYAAPKQKVRPESLDDIDPELKATFDKLGIPLDEQKHLTGVAVDAVMDSVSVKTTFRETLAELGIIFCSFSEAVREHSDLVKKYMGTVVPYSDNFFAALNSAVFSDGSFCFIPKGVKCPMDTQPCRTGTPEIRKEKGVSTILLPKEAYAKVTIPGFHGLKLRPVQPLPGNTRVVFYGEIILRLNFIP